MKQYTLITIVCCLIGCASKPTQLDTSPIIIPTVFHIIHGGGVENITDDQIIEAVKQLNEDYNAQNSGFNDVIPEFAGIKANIGISFALAKLDPNGNSTTGIVRYYDTYHTEQVNGADSDMKAKYGWPREKYYNVYVIRSAGPESGSAWAYDATENPVIDGVTVSYWAVGRTRTAKLSKGSHKKIMTHETGHWLSLPHTFSGGCKDKTNDGIADTPATEVANGCDLKFSPCGHLSNVQNYMDYSDCAVMFTEDQKTEMISYVNNPKGVRNNLWKSENLIATGVIGEPISAQFYAYQVMTVAGNAINFYDYSESDKNNIIKWQWEFPGGTPSKHTGPNPPKIIYNKNGVYDVELSVTDDAGNTDIEIKKNHISVQSDIYMQNADFAIKKADFYDPGYKGRYGNRTDLTLTLRPQSKNKTLKAVFKKFRMQDDENTDYLEIYDGPSTQAKLIARYKGFENPGVVNSSHPSGALTFVLHTDVMHRFDGWHAEISEITKGSRKPKADFIADTTSVCRYGRVQFTDTSDFKPTSWKWYFPGGDPAASTLQNPRVTYIKNGQFNVSLQASNKYGKNNRLIKKYINSGIAQSIPYHQDFEQVNALSDWQHFNPDGRAHWHQNGLAGFESKASMYIENTYYSYMGELDEITLPGIDFSADKKVQLSFNFAHINYSEYGQDVFRIYASNDCGMTWHSVYKKTDLKEYDEEKIKKEGYNPKDWLPTKDDWETINIDLSRFAGDDHVLIKFSNVADYGTRIWIDNVKINVPPGKSNTDS